MHILVDMEVDVVANVVVEGFTDEVFLLVARRGLTRTLLLVRRYQNTFDIPAFIHLEGRQ